jgi:hypothetical protein
MARHIKVHDTRQALDPTDDAMAGLEEYLTREIEDAISSRHGLEKTWRELMRQYEGVPKNPVSNFPIENAPNVEVTLGAIASDALYASMVDLIYTATPLVTIRGVPKREKDEQMKLGVKAFQRFINWVASHEANCREASEDSLLDNVQLGTGIYYIPWNEETKKTRTARVVARGPRIWSIPVEDCIVPGGCKTSDVDELPWIALRFWLTDFEMADQAIRNKWDVSHALPSAAKDWVSTRREQVAKHIEGIQRKGSLFEILDCYVYYDIDGDGIREDLYVVFDRTSRKVLYISYNPYDRRPIKGFVYQKRPHMWYGLGVLQMLSPYQEELTDLHNFQTLNALLANCRIWKGREGRIPNNMRIWPNRVIELLDPDGDLKPEQMADTYASLPQIQFVVMQLAEKRVGANELAPSPRSNVMGSRMPGITAISLLQQVNKRFTPAFDGARMALSQALMQCMYRYQERVLAGDMQAVEHIYKVLGDEDGTRVIGILSDRNFDENMIVEMTAASASINREADRQNSMLLVQILSQYYARTLELVMIASNPQTPEAVKTVAMKIAESAGEVIDRTIRTFDQVRDPALFLIEVEEEMQQAIQTSPPGGIEQLMGMLGGEEMAAGPPQIPMM